MIKKFVTFGPLSYVDTDVNIFYLWKNSWQVFTIEERANPL